MTRVIAGTAGGRRLKVPDGRSVRPTGDRVKEAMFSSIGDVTDAVVLDLFAGTGGLGIEALSRGAARAVFVERDRRTLAVLRENLEVAGVADRSRVVPSAAAAFAGLPSGGPFDLVLADPPYDVPADKVALLLAQLESAEALRGETRIVLERPAGDEGPVPRFLSHDKDRNYGETVLRYFTRLIPEARVTPDVGPAPETATPDTESLR